MSYQQWLEAIDILKKSNNQELKNKLLNEPQNENITQMLEPKLIELIKYKFVEATKEIIRNLDLMFEEKNFLDLNLVDFKKKLSFINELTYIKEISLDNQKYLRDDLKQETISIYNILIKKANSIDNIGIISTIIKNNMYKWSDEDEL